MNKAIDHWEQISRCHWKLATQSFVSNYLLQFTKIYGFDEAWKGIQVCGYQFTVGGGPASSSGQYVLFHGSSLVFQDLAGIY
jgi:hypothetical protein